MCEFCENIKDITVENADGMVSHWNIIKGKEFSRLYCRMGNASNAYGMKIWHCPICGRKLSEVSEQ